MKPTVCEMVQNKEAWLWCIEMNLGKRCRLGSQLCHLHITCSLEALLGLFFFIFFQPAQQGSSMKALGKLGQGKVSSCTQFPGTIGLSSPV